MERRRDKTLLNDALEHHEETRAANESARRTTPGSNPQCMNETKHETA